MLFLVLVGEAITQQHHCLRRFHVHHLLQTQAVQFEMDVGNTEVAIAYVQAVLEFTALCPAMLPPPAFGAAHISTAAAAQHKRRLFEAFWDAGAPLAGDVGGKGWGETALQEPQVPSRAGPGDALQEGQDGMNNAGGGDDQQLPRFRYPKFGAPNWSLFCCVCVRILSEYRIITAFEM